MQYKYVTDLRILNLPVGLTVIMYNTFMLAIYI